MAPAVRLEPVTVEDGARFASRAVEIRRQGKKALRTLPNPERLTEQPAEERRAALAKHRVELYAIASVVADLTVQRARDERPDYPPYGLVRSMHSQLRLVSANPEPWAEGSIDSFLTLGRAYLDTMVFHLDAQIRTQRASEQIWMLQRLEELLTLFRIDADEPAKARMRNAMSFMYGGLQFGVSVCSQLVEVMAKLLEPFTALSPEDKAVVMVRSLRPANRLAGLNLDHVIPAYQAILAPSGWMQPEHFQVQMSGEAPWRIDLADAAIASHHEGDAEHPTTYPTQGCPARASSPGRPSAIAVLWRWAVELAHDTGLLGAVEAPIGDEPLKRVAADA